MFTPRVWGWFANSGEGLYSVEVYPTGVGMVRIDSRSRSISHCLPHGCGDGSIEDAITTLRLQFTPRVWGWFVEIWFIMLKHMVYPTGVGMVPAPRVG